MWYLSIFCTAICAIPLCCNLYSNTFLLLTIFIKVCPESVMCWQYDFSDKYTISVILFVATDCLSWKRVARLFGRQHRFTNHEVICYAVIDNPLPLPPTFLVKFCPRLHYNNNYMDKQTEFIQIERCKTTVYTIETQLSVSEVFH